MPVPRPMDDSTPRPTHHTAYPAVVSACSSCPLHWPGGAQGRYPATALVTAPNSSRC